ncbi:hypothetical protein SDC9_86431 [bioreactor metagenome]|uniref:Uncharacterized protein n=1 Tax=bioreactor metagenome TaxID=1076179 RepID=A0A644ZG32_9ZZZZ
MLRYGTQFRANDTPFDFIENFHRIVQLRMMLGSKVPVHSDPACWRPDELPENIARHMIAAIAGVPMLSMELGELSETGEALIRYYLEIYKTHRPLFANGTWRFRYEFDRVAWLSVKDCKCCAAWVTDEESAKEIITGSPAELCLFNLGANPIMLPPGGTVFNYTGHRMTSDKVLPIAGMVKFRK